MFSLIKKLFHYESEIKQTYRDKNVYLFCFFISMRIPMYYLLSFRFHWKDSWWNQEQMFVDKHFLHFSSSKCDFQSSLCLGDLSEFSKNRCLARNSISRLNEFSFSCCFGFWINHDCNGIFCCSDLSHALKQLLNARLFLWKSPEYSREEKKRKGHKTSLLYIFFELILKLIYARSKRNERSSQLSLNDRKKDYLGNDSPIQLFFSSTKENDDSADVSAAGVNRTLW